MTEPPSLAARLERDRLLHRARRIEQVLAALQDRAVYRRSVEGAAPAPLTTAIEGFAIELGRLRRRLADLPDDRDGRPSRRPRTDRVGTFTPAR